MLKIILILFILTLSFNTFAQDTIDSSFLAPSKSRAIAAFTKQYDAQLSINKGVIFRPIDSKTYSGSTYLNGRINKGKVQYGGEWYNDVNLVYDLKSDNLIHVKSTGEWIGLIKDEVKNFTLGNRHFINMKFTKDSIPTFYEIILSDQKNQLLAEHSIKIGNYNTRIFRREIEQRVRYVIHNKNAYYAANSKNDVLKAFKDKKHELAKFIKKEDLDFNDSLETSIREVMRFYNELN